MESVSKTQRLYGCNISTITLLILFPILALAALIIKLDSTKDHIFTDRGKESEEEAGNLK